MDLLTDGLAGLASIALAYIVVLILVRLAGRRTVSQMSAFDIVITIALGSLLAQTSTSGTGLVRGLVAVSGLIGMQALIGLARRKSSRVAGWVDFTPRVVVHDGRVRHDALGGGLGGPQMTEQELLMKLRACGVEGVPEVEIAILEPSGGVSLLVREAVTRGTGPPDLWIVPTPR